MGGGPLADKVLDRTAAIPNFRQPTPPKLFLLVRISTPAPEVELQAEVYST